MIVCKLSDQLGNQMFAYASTKCIALDKGYKFGLLSEYDNQFLKNDKDEIFGCNLTSIFEIPKSEVIKSIPDNLNEYWERITRSSLSTYVTESLEVKDNTLMRGHYICPKYFMHRIDEVREWFKFPENVENEVLSILNNIRIKYPTGVKFCSVHFRNALDYRIKGFMLSKYYWEKAANCLLAKEKKVVFIVFYDKKTKLVESFIKKFQCETIHNSLFKDFNLISKCDFHIVCNSSFSIMAALMDKKNLLNTFCPSIWPIPKGYAPVDIYPSEWTKIPINRNVYSYLIGCIAPLLSPLKYLIRRK